MLHQLSNGKTGGDFVCIVCKDLLWLIWEDLWGFYKAVQEHDYRSLTKCCALLANWLCISLITVLEMSQTQMLEASLRSSRVGLVLEGRVAIVELYTDCRGNLSSLFLNGIWQWLKSFSVLQNILPMVSPLKEYTEIWYS